MITQLFIIASTAVSNPVCDTSIENAIIQVESNGNPNAKGDKDKYGVYRARGILQIHKCMVDYLNENGYNYTWDDAWNETKSRDMFRAYCKLIKGRKPANMTAAKYYSVCWNGGPNGYKRLHLTEKYWKKVRAEL